MEEVRSTCLTFSPYKDPDELCSGKFCVEVRKVAGYVTTRAFINGHPAGFLCNTCVKHWKRVWGEMTEDGGEDAG